MTDAQGHRVDFRNTIIVLTSNLGSQILLGDSLSEESETVSEGDDQGVTPEMKKAVMDIVASTYPPEFINRLDEFIIFQRLSREALRDIVDIRMDEIKGKLRERRITLEVGDDVKSWLCKNGHNPRYGARPLNRLITREIVNRLANELVSGNLRGGGIAKVLIQDLGDGLEVISTTGEYRKDARH